MQGSAGATAFLDIDGMTAGAQLDVEGELWIVVESTADHVGCPDCGTGAVGHGRRVVRVRDLPIAGRRVVLVWRKRLWRCPDADCTRKTWSEQHPAIAPRSSMTERARAEVGRRVGEDADTVAEVARDVGVGWHAVMAAVVDYGEPLIDDPDRLGAPTALGVDETVFLSLSPQHPTLLVTGFVDLDRHRLLDVAFGRTGDVVRAWLDRQPQSWRDQIEVAVVDPFRGYFRALVDRLPDAIVVVDHFHAIRLANACVDDVRRRVQQDTLGHRGRRDDPLYRIRRRLLVAHDKLSERGRQRIVDLLLIGDRDGQVADAYVAKELLREVYSAGDMTAAQRALEAFYAHCAQAGPAEVRRLTRTVRSWENEILAYHLTGMSNGPTEAINLLIKKIKRAGHGYRNFRNYRLRILLHCGVEWHTQPAARIRGRQPRLAA